MTFTFCMLRKSQVGWVAGRPVRCRAVVWSTAALAAVCGGAWSPAGVLCGADPAPAATPVATAQPGAPAWESLFDGRTLAGWKVTNFGGEGEVYVEDGAIILEMGSSLTGITGQKKIPVMDYELELEARRLDGVDFFCALTFPVAASHCTFVVGGWAGAVVGISSIDGYDASLNETTKYMAFKKNQWYRIRVRVRADRIEAWIDNERMVDLATAGKKLGTRAEVDLSRPYGVASWETRAAVRNIRVRKLAQP